MSQRHRSTRPRPRRPAGTPPFTAQDIARAAALKGYRERADLTQTELASMLGISQSSVAAYEAGKTPLPDDVFQELTRVAEEQVRAAAEKAGIESEPPPTGAPGEDDLPPELQAMLEGAQSGAEVTPEMLMKAMQDALPEDKRAAARNVEAFYELLGHIAGRFDRDLGNLIQEQRKGLAISVVQAAEVSPLVARIVEMMKIGPVSNMIILHAMLLLTYDDIRRKRNEEQRALAAVRTAGEQKVEIVPLPAQSADLIESPFAVSG